jgi:hypothetical protein
VIAVMGLWTIDTYTALREKRERSRSAAAPAAVE